MYSLWGIKTLVIHNQLNLIAVWGKMKLRTSLHILPCFSLAKTAGCIGLQNYITFWLLIRSNLVFWHPWYEYILSVQIDTYILTRLTSFDYHLRLGIRRPCAPNAAADLRTERPHVCLRIERIKMICLLWWSMMYIRACTCSKNSGLPFVALKSLECE